MSKRRLRPAIVPLGVLVLSVTVAALVSAFPLPNPNWLSRKINAADQNQEANQYYNQLQAPPTFELWKQAYGFPGSPEVNAIYYNAGDLGFGRDMHCTREDFDELTNRIACYVNNHGFGPGGPAGQAVNAAIGGHGLQ